MSERNITYQVDRNPDNRPYREHLPFKKAVYRFMFAMGLLPVPTSIPQRSRKPNTYVSEENINACYRYLAKQ